MDGIDKLVLTYFCSLCDGSLTINDEDRDRVLYRICKILLEEGDKK